MEMLNARLITLAIAIMGFVIFCSEGSRASLYLPEDLSAFSEKNPALCGLRADYILSDSKLRVEVLVSQRDSGATVVSRVYQPNSVGPLLRDIWLRTDKLLTVNRFKPASRNSNGIFELRGELEANDGQFFLQSLKTGNIEISIVFDGVLPAARLPVGLPSPLPDKIQSDLHRCLEQRD